MNRYLLSTVLVAVTALGGCATYDYRGSSAPGGYYYGRPTTTYSGGSIGLYGNGYYGYGGGYGGYYGYPGYGYNRWYGPGYVNPYYPGYRPAPRPPHRPGHPDGRPDRPDHRPDHGNNSGKPPWRDPTNGAWQGRGDVPRRPNPRPRTTVRPVEPTQAAPRVQGPRLREMPVRIVPKGRPGNPRIRQVEQ
ncbi:hypothetical protein [Pseudoxanthomonas dokdonensis]|uniref:hypothetical protein n=1 Tax=Pseudoxanthomonas dokdonensis TaxID=344882 RepID=UPI0012EDFDA6|nr:hypothetical protein [Pseudoxanthomonas dokdonensis]